MQGWSRPSFRPCWTLHSRSVARPRPRSTRRRAMAVFLALLLTLFIGMTGLAVDFAFSTFERPALQNAAHAAALTGAIDLSQGAGPTADVTTIAGKNATISSVGCQYVNAANTDVGGCTGSAVGASGVHVTATHTRDTFFMRVLGVPTVTI